MAGEIIYAYCSEIRKQQNNLPPYRKKPVEKIVIQLFENNFFKYGKKALIKDLIKRIIYQVANQCSRIIKKAEIVKIAAGGSYHHDVRSVKLGVVPLKRHEKTAHICVVSYKAAIFVDKLQQSLLVRHGCVETG